MNLTVSIDHSKLFSNQNYLHDGFIVFTCLHYHLPDRNVTSLAMSVLPKESYAKRQFGGKTAFYLFRVTLIAK